MRFPHLASYPAFKLPDDVNVDELLQGETVAIAAESDGILSSATRADRRRAGRYLCRRRRGAELWRPANR